MRAGATELGLALTLMLLSSGTLAEFRYTAKLPDDGVVIDTRTLEQCRSVSLAGARCLPAADLLGPHRRLPSFRDILWLLGTAGLRGDEQVTVVGGDPRERDFIAALLYLAGQSEVAVVTAPLPRLLAAGAAGTPGRQRGMIRDPVFRAPMRERLLVLREELWVALQGSTPPVLFDGRSDAEYRGEWVRGQRGGRLPGAISRPDSALRAAQLHEPIPSPAPVIAYGHDPVESLAYFTLLRAGAALDARVYFQGWREWAARSNLPVDHETLPEPANVPVPPPVATTSGTGSTQLILLVAALAVALITLFFALRTQRSHRWTS